MKFIQFFLIILLSFASSTCFAVAKQPQAVKTSTYDLKKGVVSVYTQVIKAAYGASGPIMGSGFVIDKKLGIIATNDHIASSTRVEETQVAFHNGKEIDAKVLYRDPWQDFVFLQVAPEEIPEDVIAITISGRDPVSDQPVTIIGNNQGKSYSLQEGRINSVYSIMGFFPGQHLNISVNVKGGSSGSPVLDEKGEAIGIVFAGNDTYVNAIPIQYLRDAINILKNNQKPQRNDTGALLDFISLDRLVKFNNFPKDIAKNYIVKSPQYMNLAIVVRKTITGTPASQILMPGDVIWSINNNEIGASLYKMQKIMNESADKVELGVYRNGQNIKLSVPLYNLESAVLKKMLTVSGATFFEADDLTRAISSAPLNTVVVKNTEPGTAFDVFPGGQFEQYGYFSMARILRIKEKSINSLNDFTSILPELAQKQYFSIDYQTLSPFIGFNYVPVVAQSVMRSDVQYHEYGSQPVLLEYNEHKMSWESNVIK